MSNIPNNEVSIFNLVQEVANLEQIKPQTQIVNIDITNANTMQMQLALAAFEEENLDETAFNIAVANSYRTFFNIIYFEKPNPDKASTSYILFDKMINLVFGTRFLKSLYEILKSTGIDEPTRICINSAFYNMYNEKVNDNNIVLLMSIINVINVDKYSAILPLSKDNTFTTLLIAAEKSNYDRYRCIMNALNICYNFSIIDSNAYTLIFSQLFAKDELPYVLYCAASIDLYADYHYHKQIYAAMIDGILTIMEEFPLKHISIAIYTTSTHLMKDNKYKFTFTSIQDTNKYPRIISVIQNFQVTGVQFV